MRGIDKTFAGVPALAGASLEVAAGRGACADRPERRRQVDDDQDPDRRLPPGRRRGRASTASRSTCASPQEAQRARHQHDLPGDQPGPLPLGGREHLPRPRAAPLRPARLAAACTARRPRCCAASTSTVDVRRPLMSFNTAIQQMVAIARAVSFEAKLVIMDEPTSLARRARGRGPVRRHPPAQARGRGGRLRQPQARRALRGLRPGHDHARRPHRRRRADGRDDQAAAGRGHARPRPRRPCGPRAPPASTATPMRSAASCSRADHRQVGRRVRDVSVEVAAGEIVGLAGPARLRAHRDGARGLRRRPDRRRQRSASAASDEHFATPADAIAAGIGFCSEDRKVEGIVPDMSVRENLTLALLPQLSRAGVVDEARQREIVERFIAQARHQVRRPRAEDPRALRRQPAEGAARPLAVHEPQAADPRRADPRHRRRRQGRDPGADPRARRPGPGRADDLLRARGGDRGRRPGLRAARRPDRGRARQGARSPSTP